jgi:hypothetical protein
MKVRFCFVAFSSLKRKTKDASSSQNGESVTAKLLLLVMMLMLSSSRKVLLLLTGENIKVCMTRDVLLIFTKKSSLTCESRCERKIKKNWVKKRRKFSQKNTLSVCLSLLPQNFYSYLTEKSHETNARVFVFSSVCPSFRLSA